MKRLYELNLRDTQVSELGALSSVSDLSNLYLGGTRVSDVPPLAQLRQLNLLDLVHTRVSDLSPLIDLRTVQVVLHDSQQVDVPKKLDGRVYRVPSLGQWQLPAEY